MLSLFPFYSLPLLSCGILSDLQFNLQLGWSILLLLTPPPPVNAGTFLSFFGPFCGCQLLARHEHTLPKDQKQSVEGQAAGILQRESTLQELRSWSPEQELRLEVEEQTWPKQI